VIPMVICWRWLRPVFGKFTDFVIRRRWHDGCSSGTGCLPSQIPTADSIINRKSACRLDHSAEHASLKIYCQ